MRWETEATGVRSLRTCAQHLVALVLLGIAGLAQAQSPSLCTPALGRIVSLQGTIELLRHGSGLWERLTRLDTAVCLGDRLRAGLLSRAAMYINPETIVRLDQNTTLELVEQTDSETILRFHQDDLTHALASQSNFCGVGYFITRFPRKLRVRTPFYNAVVEGTEFQVAMTCDRGELAVFEGRVAAESLSASHQRVVVGAGESTSVGIGESPSAIKALVKPADAVQWALYYLPLTDVSLLTPDALGQGCDQVAAELRSSCVIRRAEYLLRVGRAPEARVELSALLAREPNNGDVLALEAIIAVVQNDKAAALDFAQRAVTAAPNVFRPYAALSYAQQANFKLEEAFDAAKRAAELAPNSALLRARTAELQLSLGRVRSAEREAVEAVRLNPNESRAHLILGFVHLAQIDTNKATEDFTRAIELDSTEPLARLGLGLATIREGRLQEGREQIEIAVALDPTNSLVRSYVGKAYYEENTKERDRLAATQFGLAKALDPNDPTPWFYDAILKQTQNRPVEALEDLQKSIELNDNRAVYRSRLLLDEDQAARSANLSDLYNRLGFRQLAVKEATAALTEDPSSYSAHRLLADTYQGVARYEVSRASEVLQSQVRQPLATLWPAQLAEEKLVIPSFSSFPTGNGASLARIGIGEYTPLFARNGVHVRGELVGGNRSTLGNSLSVAALSDRIALSAAQYHFATDGFHDENNLRKNAHGALLSAQLTPSTVVQGELRRTKTKREDLFWAFDPTAALPLETHHLSDVARIGFRRQIGSTSDLVLSLAHERITAKDEAFGLASELEGRNSSAEVQGSISFNSAKFILGGAYYLGKQEFGSTSDTSKQRQENLYAYSYIPIAGREINATLGFSTAFPDEEDVPRRDFLSPKIGVVFRPMPATQVRAAYFRTLAKRLVGSQTLEPVHIAGFAQFFDDFSGTVAHSRGLAVDHMATSQLHLGIESLSRKIKIPVFRFVGTGPEDVDWNERSLRAYSYWTPAKQVALSAEYRYDHADRTEIFTGLEGVLEVSTHRIPLSMNLFNSGGLSVSITQTYIRQDGEFMVAIGFPIVNVDDSFWLTDVSIRYELPRRRGFLALEARNLFDHASQFQDLDPINPGIPPGRVLLARVHVSF